MNYIGKHIKTGRAYLLFSVYIIFLISGCAGPKIASDLLVPTVHNNKPLVNTAVVIFTEIDPSINNYEGIDAILKESLDIALKKSNIFSGNSSNPYTIKADILEASQSPWSFGNFEGKLKVNYTLFNSSKDEILNETIYTEAGSDKWSFAGAKRHRRARAVNISKNVLQFVNLLQSKFGR